MKLKANCGFFFHQRQFGKKTHMDMLQEFEEVLPEGNVYYKISKIYGRDIRDHANSYS